MTIKNKTIVLSAFVVLSFALLTGPTAMSSDVFAQGNRANQGINQGQFSNQGGLCVSGTGTLVSCNNLNQQTQANTGNNALAQQGGQGGGQGGGNKATQGINQGQSSNQNSGVVSGESTTVSENNQKTQAHSSTVKNKA